MSRKLIVCLALIVVTLNISIPCVQYQSSRIGNASDCSITRVDDTTLSWGVNISFSLDYNWTATSFSNVLADMGSPRLPIFPNQNDCQTKEGIYNKGQSVLINCTQSFDAVPVGYSNVITAFDEDDYPLGFSTKVPLSSPNSQNLQTQ